VPVNGSQFDPRLAPVYQDSHRLLPGVRWFDAHTHIGHNDPDGRSATADEILAGLDQAGHARALLFAMHEPDGYPPANDAVLAACAASDGRLLPLARIAPNAPDALDEAHRCLEAGARGFKLHPRSDAFALPNPVVDAVVALAHEARRPVLFHAGRGIPHLGESVVELARRYPDARLILAHAGISDLGWIADAAAELPNLLFDTAWWNVSDQLQLFATLPPGQILYGSDMPYGPGVFTALLFSRVATSVGLGEEACRAIAGEQLERVIAGEQLADLGPPPGVGAVGARMIASERVATFASIALQLAFRGIDPAESLALARSACQTTPTAPQAEMLRWLDRALTIAQEAAVAHSEQPLAAMPAAIIAMAVAGTPAAGVPTATLA
jgi:uncharacterized protein